MWTTTASVLWAFVLVRAIPANAAINDRRIKAIGTVSIVNIGQMFRNGWDNNVKDSDALPYLQAGSDSRTSDASGNDTATMPIAPLKEEDAPNEELRQAWEYYHTDRAAYCTALGYGTARSLTQLISYDAFFKAEAFLTQPLLTVVGSDATQASSAVGYESSTQFSREYSRLFGLPPQKDIQRLKNV
ncbi:hypothetical protein KUL152_09320 [Tenacibaculum sp. KUL152]|nr:hypothetical protein KUL152_09320 [Tenacibaculum sp. KUL152]